MEQDRKARSGIICVVVYALMHFWEDLLQKTLQDIHCYVTGSVPHTTKELGERLIEEEVNLLIVGLSRFPEDQYHFLLAAMEFGKFGVIMLGTNLQIEKAQAFFTSETAVIRFINVETDGLERLVLCVEEATTLFLGKTSRGRGRPRVRTQGYELSAQEYKVATLIAEGHTNAKIAETLALKDQTVKNLVSSVIRKLHCENRVQVALKLSRQASNE